jgi:hypothetical protein
MARLLRWTGWLAAVPTVLPVAFCFVFAFWELRTAEKFQQRATAWEGPPPTALPIDEGLLRGPAAGLEAALLRQRVSVLETELFQLRRSMVSNGYTHEASAHRTSATVLTLAGMLGGALLTPVFGMRRDVRQCRERVRHLEEELATRESHRPADWCSGASLERHVKRVTPQPAAPRSGS